MHLKTPCSDWSYQRSLLQLFFHLHSAIMYRNGTVPSASINIAPPSHNTSQTIHNDGSFSFLGISSFAQSFPSEIRRPPSPSVRTGEISLDAAVHGRTTSYYEESLEKAGEPVPSWEEMTFDDLTVWWKAQDKARADHEELLTEKYKAQSLNGKQRDTNLAPPGTHEADVAVWRLGNREVAEGKNRKDRKDANAWGRRQYWDMFMRQLEGEGDATDIRETASASENDK
jgi:hypothetical protein